MTNVKTVASRVFVLIALGVSLAGCVVAQPAPAPYYPSYGYYAPAYPYGGYSSFNFSYRGGGGGDRWHGHDGR